MEGVCTPPQRIMGVNLLILSHVMSALHVYTSLLFVKIDLKEQLLCSILFDTANEQMIS